MVQKKSSLDSPFEIFFKTQSESLEAKMLVGIGCRTSVYIGAVTIDTVIFIKESVNGIICQRVYYTK